MFYGPCSTFTADRHFAGIVFENTYSKTTARTVYVHCWILPVLSSVQRISMVTIFLHYCVSLLLTVLILHNPSKLWSEYNYICNIYRI